MAQKDSNYKKIITVNRKAGFEYFIEDKFEVGIVLLGSEIKSIRANNFSLNDAYVEEMSGELYLISCHITEYKQSNQFNHEPMRPRKLLLHKKQIAKLIGILRTKGQTIVPLNAFFNHKNMLKLEIAVVKGKKLHDKRESIKQADWNRQKARLLRN